MYDGMHIMFQLNIIYRIITNSLKICLDVKIRTELLKKKSGGDANNGLFFKHSVRNYLDISTGHVKPKNSRKQQNISKKNRIEVPENLCYTIRLLGQHLLSRVSCYFLLYFDG